MGAARRFVRSRLTTFAVVAGGTLLAMPSVGLAADWSPTVEPIPGSSQATSVVTDFGGSSALTAVWDDPATGIESSVRSAASANWAAATNITTDTGASAPSVAVAANNDAVAAWIGVTGEIYAAVRTGTVWSAPIALAAGSAVSPQAAFGGSNQIPTVFWISGNTIQTATWSGVSWTVSTPSGATPPADQAISNLHVAISSNGSGVAAWVGEDATAFHIGYAQIAPGVSSGVWSVASTSSPIPRRASSDVAVAANASGSPPSRGASPPRARRSPCRPAPDSRSRARRRSPVATQPALAIDSNGRLFAAAVASGSVKAKIRETNGTWGTVATLGSGGQSIPTLSADPSGDVVAAWVTGARAELQAYDATAPVLTVHPPADPSPPGTLSWSVTPFDLWSPIDSTTAHWTFKIGSTSEGPGATGESVTHASPTPGQETATVTESDASGNVGSQSASITISPVPPHNSQVPVIDNAAAAADHVQLTFTPGTWTGNPAPGVVAVWQRCTTSSNCTTQQTGGAYTLTVADVGSTIRILETATNSGGTVVATSVATPVVAPVSSDTPQVLPNTGLADGDTVSASSPPSDWDGATGLTFDYRFQHCAASCIDVQTGTGSTYVLGPNDVGQKMRVIVQARSGPAGGPFSAPASSTSPQTVLVAPTAKSAPTLTGGHRTDRP